LLQCSLFFYSKIRGGCKDKKYNKMYIFLSVPQYLVSIDQKYWKGLACETEKKGGEDKSASVGGGLE